MKLAASIGASFIVWPGSEGYNYLFQRRYADTWKRFVDGIAEITLHAASHAYSARFSPFMIRCCQSMWLSWPSWARFR